MIWGILLILGSFYILFSAEECRRKPEKCANKFMTKQGNTGSTIALIKFFGKPDEARQAIVSDPKLRRQFLIEMYLWALSGFVVATVYLLWL